MRRPKTLVALAAVVLLLASLSPLAAERGDDSKRKSKNGMASGSIDGISVTVEYGRPSVRGRTIWGDLVPYDAVWRTGADEATTISFDTDVVIEEAALAAGTYSLFTIPSDGEWTVIFNAVADQWGAFNYDPNQDALRVEVEPTQTDHAETLAFEVLEDNVTLRWERLAVSFSVAAAG